MSMDPQCDVLIAGAGPVGLTMGLALTRFAPDIKVVINDIKAPDHRADERCSALVKGVTRVFQALGIWDRLLPEAGPVRGMYLTDSDEQDLLRPLFLGFESDPDSEEPFAHMVPNATTIGILLEEARAAGIAILAPRRIAAVTNLHGAVRVRFDDDTKLDARVIVAADGARSQLRDMGGIKTRGHCHGQSGIVCTVAHEIDHQQIAYQHFLPSGPFATLPLPRSRSSLVWTEKIGRVSSFLELTKQDLALEIEKRTGSTLGKVVIEGSVQAFPLKLQVAEKLFSHRMALVGDAAHVLHPIAGQGLNQGIKDVAVLAELLVEAMRLGEDIGGQSVLQQYDASRRLDTGMMVMVTETLNLLFSNNLPPLRVVRDLGLGLVDRTPALKSMLVANAAAANSASRLLDGKPI